MYDWLIFDMYLVFEIPFLLQFLCSIHVFCDCERFSFLLELQHLLREVSAYFR